MLKRALKPKRKRMLSNLKRYGQSILGSPIGIVFVIHGLFIIVTVCQW